MATGITKRDPDGRRYRIVEESVGEGGSRKRKVYIDPPNTANGTVINDPKRDKAATRYGGSAVAGKAGTYKDVHGVEFKLTPGKDGKYERADAEAGAKAIASVTQKSASAKESRRRGRLVSVAKRTGAVSTPKPKTLGKAAPGSARSTATAKARTARTSGPTPVLRQVAGQRKVVARATIGQEERKRLRTVNV